MKKMLKEIEKILPEVASKDAFESPITQNTYKKIIENIAEGKGRTYALNDDLDEIYEYIEKQRDRLEQEYARSYPKNTRDNIKITGLIKDICKWLSFYVYFTKYFCDKYMDYSCNPDGQAIPTYQTIGRLSKVPGVIMINSLRIKDKDMLFVTGTPMELSNGIAKILTDMEKMRNGGHAEKTKIMKQYDRIVFKINLEEEKGNAQKFESAALNYDEHLISENATYVLTEPNGKKKIIPHAELRNYMEMERNNIDDTIRRLYDMLEVQKAGYELYKIALEIGSDDFELIYWACVGKGFMAYSLLKDADGYDRLLGNVIQLLHINGCSYSEIRRMVETVVETLV